MLTKLIAAYLTGPASLSASIEGLSLQQMRAFPVPATWSIAQIVLHVLDADLVVADRMKRVIAEENPTLVGFDESAFARELSYQDLDVLEAVGLFAIHRRWMAGILARQSDAALQRFGTHTQRGRVSLEDLLKFSISHLEHHQKFITLKRGLLLGS